MNFSMNGEKLRAHAEGEARWPGFIKCFWPLAEDPTGLRSPLFNHRKYLHAAVPLIGDENLTFFIDAHLRRIIKAPLIPPHA